MKVIFTLLLFSIYLYSTSVTIPPGSSAKWVAQHLKDRDILSSAHMFYVYLRANQLTTKLHSGQFDIPPNVSYKQLADILTGKTQQLFRLTIPEGYTIQEIADELEAQQIITNAKQFLNYIKTKKTTAINSYLSKQTLSSFEGLFFLTPIIFHATHRLIQYIKPSSNDLMMCLFLSIKRLSSRN